jgi:hypothetical protein
MTSKVAAGGVLGLRALNRATLERQMLLRRRPLSAGEASEHLVGMQAQAPTPPTSPCGRGLRVSTPTSSPALSWSDARYGVALMRNTVHLVSARDCLKLRPLVQPVIDRGLYANRADRAGAEGVDVEALRRWPRAA